MKRLILCLAVGAGLILGCSDTQAVATAAGLSGTYDLTIVGQYVFVTSSDRNELRVLDLQADPRDFVRAPNPLEPLAIPVLERPTYLTRDVAYPLSGEQAGGEVTGPYVYARSDGAQAISVVAAGPEYLKEVLQLRDLGFVTAFAARGPGEGRSESILYYATQAGLNATLHRRLLPGPEALAQGAAVPAPETVSALNLAGETVAALLVLPSQDAAQEQLVVSTRGTGGAAGRTFRLDLTNPGAPTLVPYNFGAPVRLLATHPAVPNALFGANLAEAEKAEQACGIDTTQPPRHQLRAGEYVFGVLDESACRGGNECSGVLAVDSATGMVPLDSTGHPMIPIRTGGGLPTGLTLVRDARVNIRCTEDRLDLQARPLVGIMPSSDGQITLFDAAKLRPFDFNTSGPSVLSGTVANAAGANKLPTGEMFGTYVQVDMMNGATRSDTYRLVYEGPLPPPRRRTFLKETNCPGGGGCTFEVGSTQEAQFILPGDIVVLEGGEGALCELTVSAKDESVPAQVRLVTGPLTGGCESHRRFSLRAGPGSAAPFVVFSDVRGFEGRMAAGGIPLTLPGDFLFHPVGFTPTQQAFRARLTLKRTVGEPARGDQYTATIQSGFQPYVFSPDIGSPAAGLSGYRLPGPVSHTRVGDLDLAYIAYPSADGILQINLASITDNAALSTGLVPFE